MRRTIFDRMRWISMAYSKLRRLSRNSRIQTIIFMMALSFFVLSPWLISLSRQKHTHEVGLVILENPLPAANEVPVDVSGLIEKIQASIKKASGGKNTSDIFTPSMKALWHQKHPCRSRREIYALFSMRNLSHHVQTNPKWNSVLKEYEVLHRTCVLRMGDVTKFFLKREHIDGCKFVVAGVSSGSGIGNKALSIVSALLYAVLTQRVLLVPSVTAVPGVFCEPFEGSSWMVDPEQVWAESKNGPDIWDTLKSFYRKVDARSESDATIKSIYASSTTEDWDAQPEPRFFCDTEQAQYTQVEWINFRNNLYFVPKLFAVPSFRPMLEDLFPDRKVLTPLLRTVMLPCDPVWGRVKQVHDAHFRHSVRRVGIQERYFHGKPDFDHLHTATEESVERCLLAHGFVPNPESQAKVIDLPQAMQKTKSESVLAPLAPLNVTTIFITSLYQSLLNRLTKDYVRIALETGDAVGLIQLTHEDRQYFGLEVDRQALTEILCLSLTDYLILTPQSTFGALAQGYAGLVPWFIDLRPQTQTPCVKAQSPEVCYQIPASKLYSCPHDVNLHGQLISEVVKYINDCHLVEEPYIKVNGAGLGIQLMTD